MCSGVLTLKFTPRAIEYSRCWWHTIIFAFRSHRKKEKSSHLGYDAHSDTNL